VGSAGLVNESGHKYGPPDPDGEARSSTFVNASLAPLPDDGEDVDGYINIHESVSNLGAVVSQGDIGSSTSDDSGGGYQPTPATPFLELQLRLPTSPSLPVE